MLATLVGLSILLAVVGGTATLLVVLVGRRLRARQARRHPERAAAHQRDRYGRRLAAEWPLLAQTLGSAIGTSGPASTATRPQRSRLTTRA